MEIDLIDTFPAFLNFWESSRRDSIESKIQRWETEYLSPWPELRRKQIDEYRRDHADWRTLARRRIFPRLEGRLRAMHQTHDQLVACLGPVSRRASTLFGSPFEPRFIIYVGIGVGAGWGTRFGGRRAILFGLENAVEMGWTNRKSVEALAAHELGHLYHQEWRSKAKLAERPARVGPYWRLYEEGFATRFEHEVTGRVHRPEEPGWLGWCRENRAWLASNFLRTTGHRGSVRRFFGSWYRIRGHTECGYFLGHEIISEWNRLQTLPELAILDEEEVRRRSRQSLIRLAEL